MSAAATDHTGRFLAIGSSFGESKVLNLRSGGVLYDLTKQDKEITVLKFLNEKCEYWIVGGCWTGKLVLWNKPTQQNAFTVHAKVSISSTGDILAVDNSRLFFVSGGTDGRLQVWNLYSGERKQLIDLPNPRQTTPTTSAIAKKTSLTSERIIRAVRYVRKTIVGLLFHPVYQNLVFVMQEGGGIHALDAQLGTCYAENIAEVQANSNWALDKENMRLLIVGDLGKAILFNIEMGSR